jgi:hypothetical protein
MKAIRTIFTLLLVAGFVTLLTLSVSQGTGSEEATVTLTGTFRNDAVAIGGDTTGKVLKVEQASDNAKHLIGETVDLAPHPTVRLNMHALNELHAKRMVVRGTLTTKTRVERGTQPVVFITGFEAAK